MTFETTTKWVTRCAAVYAAALVLIVCCCGCGDTGTGGIFPDAQDDEFMDVPLEEPTPFYTNGNGHGNGPKDDESSDDDEDDDGGGGNTVLPEQDHQSPDLFDLEQI